MHLKAGFDYSNFVEDLEQAYFADNRFLTCLRCDYRSFNTAGLVYASNEFFELIRSTHRIYNWEMNE